MLRSCVCLPRSSSKRRTSSLEDTSSCRSSEIERVGANMETTNTNGRATSASGSGGGTGSSGSGGAGSLLQLFHSKNWYKHLRKPVRGLSMTKAERTMKAAILIQRWYRRYIARMEVRRQYTWKIFQSLEYAAEQDQVELYNFFNALLIHIPRAIAAQGHEYDELLGRSSSVVLDLSDLELEPDSVELKNYSRLTIKFPLTKKDINALLELFRKRKDNRLNPKYVGGILREAAMYLQRLPNLNLASTAISKQITIVGDLHGKLDDLLVIFYKNGLPSTENPYVFNGDFVDRGKKSLEILLILLACFLAFPGAVFLNRGNHEDSVMNARYGFIKEVQWKYPNHADLILKLIDEVYRWLPLGTLINNRALVVHGGISNTTNLDLIKSLDRGKYVTILRPPVESICGAGINKDEWKQLFDILWSDPQTNEGCIPNTMRAAGTYFGPDVTQDFLKKYKLKYVVRSHECKPGGYEFTHNNNVITIFSASNYYAVGSNKGAYLKFNPALEPHFVQYVSAASKTTNLTIRQKVGIIESSAIRELGARIRARREDLEQEFLKQDPDGTGIISISAWCESMEKATGMGLPWRMMRDKLAPMPDDVPSNQVKYDATLELLDSDIIISAQEAETSVADSLYENKSSLEAIFHILDKDNSGFITLDEFGEAIDLLKLYLPDTHTRDDLLKMCQMMDINKDGFVDLNEFLEAFRLCEKYRKRSTVDLKMANSTDANWQETEKKSPRSPRTIMRVAQVAAALAVKEHECEDIDPSDNCP